MFEFSEKQRETVRAAIAKVLDDPTIELSELSASNSDFFGIINGSEGSKSFRLETRLKLGAIESTPSSTNPEENSNSDRPTKDET